MGRRCIAFSQSGTESDSNNAIYEKILQVASKCLYYQNNKNNKELV